MEFPFTILEASAACGIVILGSILQGSVGFGLGPFAVPLLVLIDPVFVPGPLLLSAFFLTGLMYHREQHAVRHREIAWALAGRLIGTTIGAAVLRFIPKDHLSLFFGCIVLVALVIFTSGVHIPVIPRNLLGAGTLSGFMGTTAAIGGAPLALLYHRKEGPRLRGTLSGIFMIGVMFAIGSLVIIGRFGLREIAASLVLIPGILIGFLVSKHTSRLLDRGFIRPTILIVSGASSIVLIVRYFIP